MTDCACCTGLVRRDGTTAKAECEVRSVKSSVIHVNNKMATVANSVGTQRCYFSPAVRAESEIGP